MINPNNLKELANQLTETINCFVSEQQLETLSEKQRTFLTTLIWLDSTSKTTRDGKHPVAVIKEILKIREEKRKDETNFYLKNKLK